MASVQELLRSARDLPGDSPVRDAEILLCYSIDKPRSWLYTWPEAEVPAGSLARYQSLLERRRAGEPVAYLTGSREFWSLDIAVAPSTLIPRPETETLVEWALELELPEDAEAVDLGTGTGAIALALAREKPGWRVLGMDISEDAVALARGNAERNHLQRVNFQQSDWFAALGEQRFDLVVSNPPYIDKTDPHLSQGDVRFEPRSALVAEQDGLADLAHLVATAPQYLRAGGWLLLEHGYEQAGAVRACLQSHGFSQVQTRCDLAGCERISGGQWSAQ